MPLSKEDVQVTQSIFNRQFFTLETATAVIKMMNTDTTFEFRQIRLSNSVGNCELIYRDLLHDTKIYDHVALWELRNMQDFYNMVRISRPEEYLNLIPSW